VAYSERPQKLHAGSWDKYVVSDSKKKKYENRLVPKKRKIKDGQQQLF
jgi:hypothetical protein